MKKLSNQNVRWGEKRNQKKSRRKEFTKVKAGNNEFKKVINKLSNSLKKQPKGHFTTQPH